MKNTIFFNNILPVFRNLYLMPNFFMRFAKYRFRKAYKFYRYVTWFDGGFFYIAAGIWKRPEYIMCAFRHTKR